MVEGGLYFLVPAFLNTSLPITSPSLGLHMQVKAKFRGVGSGFEQRQFISSVALGESISEPANTLSR